MYPPSLLLADVIVNKHIETFLAFGFPHFLQLLRHFLRGFTRTIVIVFQAVFEVGLPSAGKNARTIDIDRTAFLMTLFTVFLVQLLAPFRFLCVERLSLRLLVFLSGKELC